MKKILFVNHKEKACGVQQFGKRVANSFVKNTTQFLGYYVECSSLEEYAAELEKIHPDIIVYNYLIETMPWLNPSIVEYLRKFNIKQGLIVHNSGYANFFDFYLHQVPAYPENNNNFALLRPLFEYDGQPKPKTDSKIRIGSFGFGTRTKKYPLICQTVCKDFPDTDVVIRLHLTVAHFVYDCAREMEDVKRRCIEAVTRPNVTLEFSHEFWDDKESLDFLAENDLNIYLYECFNHYAGISSSIDYLMSVRKPVAINRSNMFSHIYDAKPSICIEDNSLGQIIKNGFSPLQPYYEAWSPIRFTEHLEKVFLKL